MLKRLSLSSVFFCHFMLTGAEMESLKVKDCKSHFRLTAKKVLESVVAHGVGLGILMHEDWEKISAKFSYVDLHFTGKVHC